LSTPSASAIHVLFPQNGEGWAALARRLRDTEGEVLLVLSGWEQELVAHPDDRKMLLAECKKMHQRMRIATKHPAIAAEARAQSLRVLDHTKHIKALLHGHPKLNDALRVFSPQLWRQQLKTRLQRMGLLSMPKVRIFALVGLSIALFLIVVLRLLPSADVYVRPRQESVSQTINIFLVQSGATADISERVRHMPLMPVTVRIKKSMTFDHISKEFIGTSSKVQMTIVNKAAEMYALRSGTRVTNQAGMVFRLQSHAIVDPGKEVTVMAVADDLDLYGQIIGDRGNVPVGLRWEIPGLAPEERSLVYGENRKAAAGGTTAFKTVLRQEDLDIARKRLEQELLLQAKQEVERHLAGYNASHAKEFLQLLNYAELSSVKYTDFIMPEEKVGQIVTSVAVEGGIEYTAYAYDAQAILAMLLQELKQHVREGRRLIEDDLGREQLVAHVIDYDDSLSWIKLTVDLTGTEEYILDPLSARGALFGKTVRDRIAGVPREEALRIVRNMPEVERADIRQWPPWNRALPHIAAHIAIVPF
jgi:hypothetical protein